MCKTSLNFQISSFRSRVLVWALLVALSWSFLPSISAAQQPTATISTLSGTVLVNTQEQGIGTVLTAGDVIETQAGTTLVLELSDGSLLELGENTKLDIAVLSQTAVGARVSRVKLLWGRIRALLSSQHQIEGSFFDIETPNALIGVKFSEPDIEVSYNLEKVETVGIAHTVELLAKNLVTNEEVLVPVGSTVIIVGTTVKIVAGILTIAGATEAGTAGAGATEAATTGTGATSAGTSSTGSAGMGTGTKVAIGAGAVAVAGGVVAIAGGGDGGGDGDGGSGTPTYDATGTWLWTSIITAINPPGTTECAGHSLGNEYNYLVTITQTGNTFTIVDGDSFQGTIRGNTYTFTPRTFYYGFATSTVTGELTLTSAQTGEGTYQVVWEDITGSNRCTLILTINATKL